MSKKAKKAKKKESPEARNARQLKAAEKMMVKVARREGLDLDSLTEQERAEKVTAIRDQLVSLKIIR